MKNKGFTLIELLVVIAIIAMLIAVILPALKAAKEKAKTLYCQSNLKGLTMAVYLYATEHDNKFPGAYNYNAINWGNPWDWAWAPWEVNGDTSVTDYENATIEERYEGIERGTIYQYIENHKSYNCPTDKSFGNNFRSYSMPDCINGVPGFGNWDVIESMSQIKSPGDKYVFLEENDPRGYNINAWVIHTSGTQGNQWGDPLTVWHNRNSNLGFMDGHAETWRWSKETLRLFEDIETWTFWGYTPTTPEGMEDLNRLHRAWAE